MKQLLQDFLEELSCHGHESIKAMLQSVSLVVHSINRLELCWSMTQNVVLQQSSSLFPEPFIGAQVGFLCFMAVEGCKYRGQLGLL